MPGGDVYALAADAESALVEYLEMFYNLRHAGRTLTRLGIVDFATTIAPGLRDVLLTGKAAEATRRRTGGARLYDAVVMDAPPTGRISRFLNIATEVSGLAKVGPIRTHADTVQRVIRSPRDRGALRHACWRRCRCRRRWTGWPNCAACQGGLQLGAVMINMVRPPALTDDRARARPRRDARPARAGARG